MKFLQDEQNKYYELSKQFDEIKRDTRKTIEYDGNSDNSRSTHILKKSNTNEIKSTNINSSQNVVIYLFRIL